MTRDTHLFSLYGFGGCGSQIYVGRFTLIFNSDLKEKTTQKFTGWHG